VGRSGANKKKGKMDSRKDGVSGGTWGEQPSFQGKNKGNRPRYDKGKEVRGVLPVPVEISGGNHKETPSRTFKKKGTPKLIEKKGAIGVLYPRKKTQYRPCTKKKGRLKKPDRGEGGTDGESLGHKNTFPA